MNAPGKPYVFRGWHTQTNPNATIATHISDDGRYGILPKLNNDIRTKIDGYWAFDLDTGLRIANSVGRSTGFLKHNLSEAKQDVERYDLATYEEIEV